MIAVLLKVLGSMAMQSFAALASKEMMDWMLFKAAEAYVKSTKTTADDDWLVKFKEKYEQSE